MTTNSFVAARPDSVFQQGTRLTPRMLDIEALEAYFAAHSPVAPPALDRVHRAE